MYFTDRYDAAMKLIPFLKKYADADGVVLAVPRGGVPVGFYISKYFGFPLEVILTKKIGHPESAEFAVGAVGLESRIINHSQHIPEEYLDKETDRIRHILRERYRLYMGGMKPLNLKNKTVIIVDDGVATGNTLMATIEMIRTRHPAQLVIAVPVAPPSTAARLKKLADDFICLHTPENFMAVGQFYEDFGEVTDEQAISMLHEANEHRIAKKEPN